MSTTRSKTNERLGKRYQTRTLTCHQRLKLSFTTHLFFTVLTLFSNVGRIVTELSKCRESNSPQYICRKEDNKQNPQCQNNRGGTFPVKLRVMYAYLTLNPPHQDRHHPMFVESTWRSSGDWDWPSGFSNSRSIALPKSISCKLGSGLRNYGSVEIINASVMCQDPCGELSSLQVSLLSNARVS